MPFLTFEICQQGEAPVALVTRREDGLTWCYVEALAVQDKNRKGAIIRVKNSRGGTTVLTGVATALSSIEKCEFVDCPLKEFLSSTCSSEHGQGRSASDLMQGWHKLLGLVKKSRQPQENSEGRL